VKLRKKEENTEMQTKQQRKAPGKKQRPQRSTHLDIRKQTHATADWHHRERTRPITKKTDGTKESKERKGGELKGKTGGGCVYGK
jgi:hypothetical protein